VKWTGKLVGGFVGLLIGGPAGAAFGALAGHVVDAKHDATSGSTLEGGAERTAAAFFRRTFEVMGHVAKADGRVSEREINAARAVMAQFRLDPIQVAAAIEHFTRGKSAQFELPAAIMSLRRSCAGRPDLLRIFLEIQVRAAIEGTDLQGAARPLLLRVAAMLGVSPLEFVHLESALRQRGAGERLPAKRMSMEQACAILEVEATATDAEISTAYRRQLSRHHPDKLKANGLPESMLEHAKQRTQQIIEAHDAIRAARGIR